MRKPHDAAVHHDDVILRARAVADGGVVAVPFVGARWVDRRGGYWWRRISGTLVYLVFTGMFGAASVGIVVSMWRTSGPAFPVVAVVWLATVVPGGYVGVRMVRRMPMWERRRGVRAGCFSLLLLPFVTGLSLVMFVAALRPQFLGENRARALSRAPHVTQPPQPGQKPKRH
jgi:hypothetical protein